MTRSAVLALSLLAFALAGCPGPEGGDTGNMDAGMRDTAGLDVPGVDTPATMMDTPVAMMDTPARDAPSGCVVTGYPTLDSNTFASGLDRPIFFTGAPGTDDLFAVEQGGIIRVIDPSGTVIDPPFLDLSTIVDLGSESGLLGLAFHPDYAANGRFYVYYSQSGPGSGTGPDQVVAVGTRDTARVANPTVDVILAMADQASNHNGGCLQFGPDGDLYVATGDGGPQGDPEGDAQDTDSLLGKILRLHVDATTATYTVPAGNPFVGAAGADEVFAYGLRNPWRFSFDSVSGDLYVGDVGQSDWEEVSVVDSGTGAGTNFGWNQCEGFEGYDISSGVSGAPCTFAHHEPIVAMSHGDGNCSVMGGYVYRGSAIPGLYGAYLYGDYCTGNIHAFRYCAGALTEDQELPALSGTCNGLVSFGQDNDGELYMVCTDSGTVRRIIGG